MNKYLAEALGTAVLVFIGCGAVVASATIMPAGGTPLFAGTLGIAMAFGLAVTAMAYTIGPVSGCHINPAVTVALFVAGRFPAKDVPGYIIAQVIGGFIGAGFLALIASGKTGGYPISGGVFGQNGFTGWSVMSAFLTETIATFIFTAVILGCTRSKGGAGSMAGLVIGLTLVMIHITFIPVTGVSVNPARTIAPNIYAGGVAIEQLWLFILAPLVGAVIAGLVFKSGLMGENS
jgi:aquaporin Z